MNSPSPRRLHPFLRWTLRSVLGLALVLALGALFVAIQSERILRRTWPVAAQGGPPRPALLEEGRHLAASRGCVDCHGPGLQGRVVADDPMFGRLVGTNLTRYGSPAATHDALRTALLHGVRRDGTPLMMMPSKEYSTLSAREIEALSAYVASLPASGAPIERSRLRALGRTLLTFGKLDGFLSAERIDHDRPVTPAPPTDPLAYGKHLTAMCTGCHRADLAGGPMGHGKRGAPPASNLTPDMVTGLGRWSETDFIAAIRTGLRPDGSRINASVMPLSAVAKATDAELKAIWLYLRARPPIRRDVKTAE